MSTYLELVNEAILEAGVDLDDLTALTFANPLPTKMYPRFKHWVRKAWEDIQLENNELEFMKGRATVRIYPALLVSSGSRTTAPVAGAVFTSTDADGMVVTLQSSVLSDGGTWEAGTAEATLFVEELSDQSALKLLDEFDETSPNVGDGSFLFKYYGRYNLRNFVSDLEEANFRTFEIQDPENGGTRPIRFIPWSEWVGYYEMSIDGRGMPYIFTETPSGHLDFYPRPDRDYVITFNYTKQLSTLAAAADTPTIDARYHGAIVWLAVMYYANYDRQNDLWVKAFKRHTKYMFAIDRDLGPEVNFRSNPIYDDGY